MRTAHDATAPAEDGMSESATAGRPALDRAIRPLRSGAGAAAAGGIAAPSPR
jgi:hypothetical protein